MIVYSPLGLLGRYARSLFIGQKLLRALERSIELEVEITFFERL